MSSLIESQNDNWKLIISEILNIYDYTLHMHTYVCNFFLNRILISKLHNS